MLFSIIQFSCSDYFCVGPSFASANLMDASGSWESSVNKKIFLLSQKVIDYCHAMRGLIWNMWDGNLTMRYTLPPPYCFWRDSTFITLYYRLHITVWDRNNLVIPRVLEHTSESQKHWLLDLPPEMLIQKVCSGVKNLHFLTTLGDAYVKSPKATYWEPLCYSLNIWL